MLAYYYVFFQDLRDQKEKLDFKVYNCFHNVHEKSMWCFTRHLCLPFANAEMTFNVKELRKQKFEDTKEVIGIGKAKKDRQYNGQNKNDKRTNNDLQYI